MSNLKFSSMIFVFLVSLSSSLFTFTSVADPTYSYHICSNQNFTRNSTYQSNLNFLLSSLPSNANRSSNGFSNATAGQDPNRVYGLFQCRGDVTTSTCQDCVAFASREVTTTQRCPAQKGAVIWYDECLLRYSDSYIFSTAARNPGIFMYNTNNVTVDPSWSQALMLSLMNAAVILAANDTKKFATIKGNSAPSQRIYTLVQCTQDLSNNDCSGCLLEAISDLPTARMGGRILLPSCNCRYEFYLFYNESLTASPPPAPTPSPPSPVTRAKGKSHISSSTIIAIVAPITVAAVLLVAGYCFLTRRAIMKSNTKEGEIVAGFVLISKNSLFFLSGYMSPEYAMHGEFSVKSDVYSFGVLVLEIITGKKNSSFYQTHGVGNLLSYAWEHWRDETPMQLLDSNLTDSYSRNEVMRCIHVGLLCVQEDPGARPTMATVVHMLNSYSVSPPLPRRPAFFLGSMTEVNMHIRTGTDSDPSTRKSMPWSVDDASITELCAR
ncbi:hypothetical protein JRO89_XS06G0107300 [Xanthoceras sorbifolium]|uniref:Gnk2-homologous domain-containing protein n=1 Tax=Xanthoceras sorbifolium TaxID=99658 RepID=A0ABQ8HXM3_9ROSI|nr:hypothetical protein JRO89_XS06G0107300 [Xanthoceras sorbifolium]